MLYCTGHIFWTRDISPNMIRVCGSPVRWGPDGRDWKKPQSHYLVNDMRIKKETLSIISMENGKWEAQVKQLSKKACSLTIVQHRKDQPTDPETHFLSPAIRQNRLDFMIEKATELVVRHFHPVLTGHTSIPKINTEQVKTITMRPLSRVNALQSQNLGHHNL